MMMIIVEWLTDEMRLHLIFRRHHCQRFSPSQISDTPRAAFVPAQNLSSNFLEWSYVIVIAITRRCHSTSPVQQLLKSVISVPGILTADADTSYSHAYFPVTCYNLCSKMKKVEEWNKLLQYRSHPSHLSFPLSVISRNIFRILTLIIFLKVLIKLMFLITNTHNPVSEKKYHEKKKCVFNSKFPGSTVCSSDFVLPFNFMQI